MLAAEESAVSAGVLRVSTALQNRLVRLERFAGARRGGVELICRRIVSTAAEEMTRATFGDRTLHRHDDESEGGFIERAKAEALASTSRRPCRLLLRSARQE